MGNISATALLPMGLGARKRGIEQSVKIKSAIVNHPRVLSDDFINDAPTRDKDNEG